MMRKAGTTEQAESSVEKKNKDKMNVVLVNIILCFLIIWVVSVDKQSV